MDNIIDQKSISISQFDDHYFPYDPFGASQSLSLSCRLSVGWNLRC